MKNTLSLHSFVGRLLLAFILLIILTTLSTSIPAYWLTRRQLEQQAWQTVSGARQATLSLLQAEQQRLADLTQLLAERPTLQQLVRDDALAELPPYLADFQTQSALDILVLCQDGRLLTGESRFEAFCAEEQPLVGFVLLAGQPAVLTSQSITDDNGGQPLGQAIAGRWLDTAVLAQLATDTGVAQSVLTANGIRQASSMPGAAGTAVTLSFESDGQQKELELDGDHYLAAYATLPAAAGQPPLIAEVALPVNDLAQTETRALLILAGSTVLVAVATGLLGSWYVRQLVAPLQKLTDVAEEISSGDLMAAIPLFSAPTEVSTLATALQSSQASMLQALAERSQARDWLNTLIQSVVEGVVTLSDDGRITFFSQGTETLTGWAAPDAVGQPANTVFPLAEEVTHGNGRSFLEQIPPPGNRRQVTISQASGKSVVLAVTSARLQATDEAAAQTVLVLRDVTQEEAVRHLRSYFLANISHEFRTPLSTLQASMELLLDENEALTAPEMRELLKPSYLSLSSLQTLIDNLLESSSIEAGQFVIRPRPCQIQTSLTDALHIVQPLLERRAQTIVLEQPATLPELLADPARLTQVIVNLLTNASKYSPNQTTIMVMVAQTAHGLRVAVADEGPGISPAERAALFQRFVRLDSVDHEQYGIGLGLYVVKTVIEAHHGRVGVDERPGGGSVFWFELPIVIRDA